MIRVLAFFDPTQEPEPAAAGTHGAAARFSPLTVAAQLDKK
jgi:hypothetical protein